MTRLLVVAALAGGVAALAVVWRAWSARRRPPAAITGVDVSDGWVVFSGPFCASCRQIVARLKAAGETVAEVDVADRPDLAAAHAVSTVPTVVIVEHGRVVAGATGRRGSAELVASSLASNQLRVGS